MQPDYSRIPAATLATLKAWIETARPLGGFTEAIVTNNLREAFQRADDDNLKALSDIVCWMYWHAPYGCWGSKAVLKTWKGLEKECA